MISPQEIEKLAALSRIALSSEETEALRKDFDSILRYVEQINKVSATLSSGGKAGPLRNVMREDAKPHQSGEFTEILLSAAPKREEDYIRVKKIL